MRKAVPKEDLVRMVVAGAREWGMSLGLRKAIKDRPIIYAFY